jgi:oligoribonuclease NrnB/cAMP/cGMP phosphodiesterase (DHH superfamily)
MKKIEGKLYHLSHIDLDGYGSQFLTTHLVEEVVCFNSDYGKGIKESLVKILVLIDEDIKNEINSSLLITDLNLIEEDAFFIDEEMNKRNRNITLLDHHITGKSVSEKYDWYFLDTSICATMLTYTFLKDAIGERFLNNTIFKFFAEVVNVYDLWKEEEKTFFNYGKLLNFAIFNTGYAFPKEFKEYKSDFILYSLNFIITSLYNKESIHEIESTNLPLIKLNYLKNKIPEEIFIKDDIILDDKYNYFIYELMKTMDYPIITIDNKKIKVFYDIDGGVFQNISSIFNSEKNKEFDICINVLKSGKLSLRSKGVEEKNNVSALSQKYFNGGGHFNASGGIIIVENKKEFSKEEVLDYLKSI